MGVHPESGGGIDLDDRASGFAHRLADVWRQKVDAGHVEPDYAGGLLRDLHVVVIGLPGPVDGNPAGRHVAGGGQLDEAFLGWNRTEVETLPPDQFLGGAVELDAGQHFFVTDAAAWVAVRDIDQLADRMLPITDHVGRDSLRHRDHVAIDDQHPVVVALDKTLHNDDATAGLLDRSLKAAPNIRLAAQVEAHAAAMVAVERFGHHRVADAGGDGGRLVGGADHVASRHRKAGSRQ